MLLLMWKGCGIVTVADVVMHNEGRDRAAFDNYTMYDWREGGQCSSRLASRSRVRASDVSSPYVPFYTYCRYFTVIISHRQLAIASDNV